MATILIVSAKMGTPGFLKKRLWRYNTNKFLSRDLNNIIDVVINCSISMREVIINLTRKTFFEG